MGSKNECTEPYNWKCSGVGSMMSQWQDISTVQSAYDAEDGLSGSAILLWDGIGICLGRVFFDGEFEGWAPDGDGPISENITHWRHLPSPPSPSHTGEGAQG